MTATDAQRYGSSNRSCTGRKIRQSILFLADVGAGLVLAYAVTIPWAGAEALSGLAKPQFTLMKSERSFSCTPNMQDITDIVSLVLPSCMCIDYGGMGSGSINPVRKGLYYAHVAALAFYAIMAVGYWISSLTAESRRQDEDAEGIRQSSGCGPTFWKVGYGVALLGDMGASAPGLAVYIKSGAKYKVSIISITLKSKKGAKTDAAAFCMFVGIWLIRWILHCARPRYDSRKDDPETAVYVN